jgi:hypothetical protein
MIEGQWLDGCATLTATIPTLILAVIPIDRELFQIAQIAQNFDPLNPLSQYTDKPDSSTHGRMESWSN